MKILAFDTSTIACTVGLMNGDQIKVLHEIAPKQQTKLILPMINELLVDNGLSCSDLDAIAFGAGPGSFTGVRIATCIAQGIGLPTQIPLLPISSMAVLAQAAFLELGWTNLLVAIDARVNHVYWGNYFINQMGRIILNGKEAVNSPEEIDFNSCDEWYAIGDAWQTYHSILTAKFKNKPRKINALQLPSAAALLNLAEAKFNQGEWIYAGDAMPVYLN